METLTSHYSCDRYSLVAEMKLIPKVLQRCEKENHCKVTTTIMFAEFLGKFQIAFQEIYRLCVITLTIPASSAACESTFSCLRRLKTYLRNRMYGERFMGLAVLAVKKAAAKSLEFSDIVDAFDAAHHSRRIRLH